MKIRPALVLAVLALLLFASLANAEPVTPGTPTLRVEPMSDGFLVVGDSIAAPGGVSWNVYFAFDHSQGTLAVSPVTAGANWIGLNCGYSVAYTDNMPGPTGSGTNGVIINGFCTTSTPPQGVIGSNIRLAYVKFSSCQPSLPINLDDGVGAFGGAVASMSDPSNSSYTFTNNDLTDGVACAPPLAVTLGDVSANPTGPFTTTTYPLMAGVMVLLSAAGLAFRGMRKH